MGACSPVSKTRGKDLERWFGRWSASRRGISGACDAAQEKVGKATQEENLNSFRKKW